MKSGKIKKNNAIEATRKYQRLYQSYDDTISKPDQ